MATLVRLRDHGYSVFSPVTGRLVVFRSNQGGIFVVCIVVVVVAAAILCMFELLPSIAIARIEIFPASAPITAAHILHPTGIL